MLINRKRKGFTIVELLVSCGIVLVLLTGFFIVSSNYLSASKTKIFETRMDMIALAVKKYRLDTGGYPANIDDLTVSKNGKGPWIPEEYIMTPYGEKYNIYIYDEPDETLMIHVYAKNEKGQEVAKMSDFF